MNFRSIFALTLAGSILANTAVLADSDDDSDSNNGNRRYEVTVTNLARGQTFTPVLVASHKSGVKLFRAGEAASEELAILAESGSPAALTGLLEANPRVIDVGNSGATLAPGDSVTVTVSAHRASEISVAAMLIPTNDSFIALNGMHAPKRRGKTITYMVPAYDAGSEANDELCASIPGPSTVCAGEGVSAANSTDEGFVHISAGIQGNGELTPAAYDWRNPVAKISIRKVR